MKHLCWTGAAVGRTVLAVQAPDPIAMKLTVYAPFSRMYVVHLLPLLFATAVASLQKPSAAGRNNQRDLLQDDRKINVLQDGKQINPRLHVLQDDKKISPRLVPKSDRIFFDHDYPDDLEPHAKKTEFSHPYPAVQDTDEYDKDYVKDENNDKGEWKAQMDYDLLRTKVARQKDDLENAKDAEREMQKKLEEATKREAAAAKAAKEAAERAGLAKDHADGLKKRAKDKEDEEVRESKKLKNVKKAREQEEDDLFKEEEEQEQEDQGVACYEADVIYQPIDIPGHAREKVDSVLSCQQRCAEVKDCGYANYFPDGGCHLSGRHANKEPGVGTLSGPARCMGPRKTSAGKTSAKAVKNRGSKASILVSEELIQAKAEAQQHYARVSHIGDTDMGPIDQSVAISASMHIVGRSLWMHSGLLSLAVGLILGARFMLRDAKEIEEKGS